MKKTILMWMLMIAVGATAFAKDEETVSQQVLNNFKKEFVNAKDVNWQNSRDYVKATFSLNEQVMFAYYTPAGELIAITRNISSDKLPISLLTGLKKNYSEYWITDLFEAVTNGTGTYYITLQNADVEVILKSDEFGGWETFKKSKRS
jgi:hypothetical protein